MAINQDMVAELNLLARYDLENSQLGLKVHQDAAPEVLAAVARLHAKGLIDQPDGGYLTGLGLDAAEHIQVLLNILRPV